MTVRQLLHPTAWLALIAAGGFCLTATAQDDYYDIGDIHFVVSTDSPMAQLWFDRGLAMCLGFNHEEGVRCFERAISADPGLAMAHWGMAYAWGPNINNMLIPEHQIVQAHHAVHVAQLCDDNTTGVEQALIGALANRYASPAPEDREPLNEAYAQAMRGVHDEYGDSPIVAALFAESLMNLQPWKHWGPDGTPGKHTPEIRSVLEGALARDPAHPGLGHFYIHTMEASPTPEAALEAANAMRGATPGLGHLMHMPTHIDLWVGDYKTVIEWNQRAIAADEDFLAREGPNNFYTLYRVHNYHFLCYGAMFDGRRGLAVDAARAIVDTIPPEMLREQVDLLDAFIPTELHVMVRFGMWEEILNVQTPPADLPMTFAIWRYARTLAYAATGQIDWAEEEREHFVEAVERVPETSFMFQNASLKILEVAEAMLDGEVAYRRGDYDQAFENLREAVRLDDALNYDEPWGWMQPARHALGALLLEQGRPAESEAVYRKDLDKHPHNPWALHGLAESLAKQGKTELAEKCSAEFNAASARSDVQIDRSCYCRLNAE